MADSAAAASSAGNSLRTEKAPRGPRGASGSFPWLRLVSFKQPFSGTGGDGAPPGAARAEQAASGIPAGFGVFYPIVINQDAPADIHHIHAGLFQHGLGLGRGLDGIYGKHRYVHRFLISAAA